MIREAVELHVREAGKEFVKKKRDEFIRDFERNIEREVAAVAVRVATFVQMHMINATDLVITIRKQDVEAEFQKELSK